MADDRVFVAKRKFPYDFAALAVETMGPWSSEMKSFIKDLSTRLVHASGDLRAGTYFAQRISLAVQRGNAASVLGTMPLGAVLEEITDMPRVYKTREGARKKVPIDEGKLRSAVDDVIAGASIRDTAKGHGLAVMTLKRYVRTRKGTTTTDEIDYTPNYRHSQIFSTMEESELVNYLMMASKLYHGLTPKNLRQLAVV